MVKYASLIGTGVHTPSLRFRERIVGALKTKGVVLTEIAPTAANLNLAKAGSGLADCFGLSRDAKERKVVVQDVLRRMVTEKGKVLPGWEWVRDVSALNSLSMFDKITKMVASAARFANGTASIRKSVGVLADQKVAIALFKHAVRRGLVSCLLKNSPKSGCLGHLTCARLLRAGFKNGGAAVTHAALVGALQQLEQSDIEAAVCFEDETSKPVSTEGKRELGVILRWRLQHYLDCKLPAELEAADFDEWAATHESNHATSGTVKGGDGLVALIMDMIEAAKGLVCTKKRKRSGSEETDDEGYGSEMGGGSEGGSDDGGYGSDYGLGSVAGGSRKSTSMGPPNTRGASNSNAGGGDSKGTRSSSNAGGQNQALPTADEVVAQPSRCRQLLGLDMLVFVGQEVEVARAVKYECRAGRPSLYVETSAGGSWLDGAQALANILSYRSVSEDPMPGLPSGGRTVSQGGGPKDRMREVKDKQTLDDLLEERSTLGLEAQTEKAQKTFDLLGGEGGFSDGEQVKLFVSECSTKAGMDKVQKCLFITATAKKVKRSLHVDFKVSVTVTTILQIAFFSTLLQDLTSLLRSNAKAERSLLQNNQARVTSKVTINGVEVVATEDAADNVDLHNKGVAHQSKAVEDVAKIVLHVLTAFHNTEVLGPAFVAFGQELLILDAHESNQVGHKLLTDGFGEINTAVLSAAEQDIRSFKSQRQALKNFGAVHSYRNTMRRSFTMVPAAWDRKEQVRESKERKLDSTLARVTQLEKAMQSTGRGHGPRGAPTGASKNPTKASRGRGGGRGGGAQQQQQPITAPPGVATGGGGAGAQGAGKGGKGSTPSGKGQGKGVKFQWSGALPTVMKGPLDAANKDQLPPNWVQNCTATGTHGAGDAGALEAWCVGNGFATMEEARRTFVNMVANKGKCFHHNAEPGKIAGGCRRGKTCFFADSHV